MARVALKVLVIGSQADEHFTCFIVSAGGGFVADGALHVAFQKNLMSCSEHLAMSAHMADRKLDPFLCNSDAVRPIKLILPGITDGQVSTQPNMKVWALTCNAFSISAPVFAD